MPIIFEPDWRLNAREAIIETDFGMTQGQLVVSSRRALVKYVLQRYQIDHRNMAILPEVQQLVVSNLQDLQPLLMKYYYLAPRSVNRDNCETASTRSARLVPQLSGCAWNRVADN